MVRFTLFQKQFLISHALSVEVRAEFFQAETTDMKQLTKEVQYLRDLRHPNIIVFHDTWVDVEGMRVVMITELMRSGSIKAYIKKATPGFKLRVVKIWCRQILEALNYLHSHDPPIIHRDIKVHTYTIISDAC